MEKALLAVSAGLIGAAVGYHLRPRIIMATGGASDEAAVIARLDSCEAKLIEITQQLRHAQQVADLYRELHDRK